MKTKLITTIVIATLVGITGMYAAEYTIHERPFYAEKIEVSPGGHLILRPRLPYVKGMPPKEYTLVLDLPGGITLNPLKVNAIRRDQILSDNESVRTLTENGEQRNELSYQADMRKNVVGVRVVFRLASKAETADLWKPLYMPVFSFAGTFDWKPFEWVVQMPENVTSAVVIWLSRRELKLTSGVLRLKSFKIKETDTGNVIFDQNFKKPLVLDVAKSGAMKRVDRKGVKLASGRKYTVQCEAKGEDIVGPYTSPEKTRPFYARTFIFDVARSVALPAKLFWRLEDAGAKVYRKGEVSLVKAGPVVKPKTIDTSTWIAETGLQTESLEVQNIFVEMFDAWGLNTLEPYLVCPGFGVPLNEDNLRIGLASEAKRRGMRLRAYSALLFTQGPGHEKYLETHPHARAVDAAGRKSKGGGNFFKVCHTHFLDGGKYDSPPTSVGGGGDNPWLGSLLDAIQKSAEINGLDGIFFDFEINAAPHLKSRPKPDGSRGYTKSCICERCRRAFQQYAGLDHTPTIEECCDQLYEEYVDFRCWQNTRLWGLCRQAVRKANPKATLGLYSGVPGDYARQNYGVDWTMAGSVIDFAMFRNGGPVGYLVNFIAKTSGKVPRGHEQLFIFASGMQLSGYRLSCYERLPNLKNMIIRIIVKDNVSAVGLYRVCGADSQATLPVRQAAAMIAKYEDFFLNGMRREWLVHPVKDNCPVIAPSSSAAGKQSIHRTTYLLKDGRFVTFVFNNTGSAQSITLKHGNKLFGGAKLTIPAHDCIAHEWKRVDAKSSQGRD